MWCFLNISIRAYFSAKKGKTVSFEMHGSFGFATDLAFPFEIMIFLRLEFLQFGSL